MKKTSLPKPMIILILTLITAIVWVVLSIFRAVTVKPSATVPEKISQPLDPTINAEAIQKIESAIFFSDSEIPSINVNTNENILPSPTLASEPTEEPEASPSALPET